MAKKIESYVDTSALIAFLDRSDTHHTLFARLFSDPPSLITSPLVIAEGHAWFLKRYDGTRAMQFLNFIEELKPLSIKAIGKTEMEKAAKYIRKYSDQTLTLADSLGLFLMDQHKIKSCWSTDHHLAITGVSLVIHEF
ncbi:MAG: hypothetical protein A3G32_03130 [Deltaproteobacteria bacterium RIFCSPLOWO2_12_FULL_40_28]|nr:MAG: hypothetical protein A3C45_01815 [Deltaproteobacteria bacterium RIFCSPHIGHO2_02_FULL_40_28]OGQ19494.1 MAG: hypothetical protein A3E27_02045 [Deltaproteobacteria bacterium RIFCSPHIGHO2_12_FULL_40_32]OGQ39968.1 MAG: hypothetical protein A3I69_08010 [Deltaproteobacteria bacterium RIFCSPLOWO2_02_FULL_40_36]OGQ54358.1 MAG: hypothetical protein A3G32_03130 [Deltaproteobacteria bacterium RIFCSPLOWO2_12_FULL_40_28]